MKTALTTASPTATAVQWPGGVGWFYAEGGTWGGGTLKLLYSELPTSGGVIAGSGITLSADGITGFELPPGYLTATLVGSSGASVPYDILGAVIRVRDN
jgi:hypothetical protein